MEKNYNYQRKKLALPEYGRHISQMVDYLMTIEDRELRNSQARVVISIMGNLNPVLRDAADFNHKLWDHLFLISGFQLDVDSPYPRPSSEAISPKPEKLSYPTKKIAFKQYGKHIEEMLGQLPLVEDERQRAMRAVIIAKYMRAKAYEYNQEYPNNEVILKDIRRMTKNSVILDENALNNVQIEQKQTILGHRVRKGNGSSGFFTPKTVPRTSKNTGKYRPNNRTQHK